MSGKEAEFRQKLAAALSGPPYCHKVYLHEAPCQFSIRGAKGYIDMYVETNPKWQHHKRFPTLGIETKIASSLGWLVKAIEQVKKYSEDLAKAAYFIRGREVPPPALFLVATPESWEEGVLYKWMPTDLLASLDGKDEAATLRGLWFGLTRLYERLLMKHNAALLLRGSFFTNAANDFGAIMRYDLATFAAQPPGK